MVNLSRKHFERFHETIYVASQHRWETADREPFLCLFFTKFVADGVAADGTPKNRQERKTLIMDWDDTDRMWRAIERYNGREDFNAYISVNPLRIKPAKPGGRGKDDEYLCRIALPVDFDLAHGVHAAEGMTQEQYETSLDAMRELVGDPDLLVSTGGGIHGWWLTDSSVTTEDADRWRAWSKTLGSDPVADLPRILRIPGSLNVKGDEPQPVRLLDPKGY